MLTHAFAASVLASVQVVGEGVCWRCKSVVEKRELEQWFLKITDYAESLLAGLETLGKWPEKVVTMQRNWIGKSTGADLDFAIPALGESVRVFTTRPDTVFGATAWAAIQCQWVAIAGSSFRRAMRASSSAS